MKQRGLFDEEERLRRLSELGDTLERLNKYINWEDFRGILAKNPTKEAAGKVVDEKKYHRVLRLLKQPRILTRRYIRLR